MDRKAKKRAANKAKAIELLGGKCVECGSIDRLEFDHINRDRQDFRHALSNMWELSWERILKELEKCQLLCRSCHAVKSQTERGNLPFSIIPHGTTNGYTSRKCRCVECKRAWADYKRQQWRNKHPLALHRI